MSFKNSPNSNQRKQSAARFRRKLFNAANSPSQSVVEALSVSNARWIVPRSQKGDSKETGRIDLARFVGPAGSELPPLSLENCEFEGLLCLDGSRFSSIDIINCRGPGITGIGLQVSGDVNIRGWNTAQSSKNSYLRLRNARIGGTLSLSGSKFSSECVSELELQLRPFSDRFAVALNGATIKGRLTIAEEFAADGGISLYQAEVGHDVYLKPELLKRHEFPIEPQGGETKPKYPSALDCKGLRVASRFFVAGTKDGGPEIYGRLEFGGATICGDLILEDLSWDTSADDGGLSACTITVGGQIQIIGDSLIHHDSNNCIPIGLSKQTSIGAALDLWKAKLDRGIVIRDTIAFNGPLFLNQSRIGHLADIRGKIVHNGTNIPPDYSPYNPALDFTDAKVDGSLILDIANCGGRVSLERMRIDGSLDIRKLAFKLDEIKEQQEDPAKRDSHSLLDMQDLFVSGGINIKRYALSIDFTNSSLRRGAIADMRGMSATSWDDADGTAWQDIERRRAIQGKEGSEDYEPLWRVRFDGIRIDQIDSSNQDTPVSEAHRKTLRKYAPIWSHNFLNMPRVWLLDFARVKRTGHTLSADEAVVQRIIVLNSFLKNRDRLATHTEKMRKIVNLTEPFSWIIRKIYRHTLDASWFRRERIPHFTPQPFEVFARAYSLRGEVDIAVRLTIERVDRLWNKRRRDFNRSYTPPALTALVFLEAAYLVFAFQSLFIGLQNIRVLSIFALATPLVFLIPYVIGYTVNFVARWGFAYGLGTINASISLVSTIIAIPAVTLMCVDGNILNEVRTREPAFWGQTLMYGVDKVVPGIESKIPLYPELTRSGESSSGQSATGESKVASAAVHDHSTGNLVRWLDIIWDIIGTAIFSAAIFTYSGFMRRDIERK